MIDQLKPYPSYNDSGVQWLREVPAHWQIRRIKRIARLNPSKSEVPLKLRNGQAVFLPMERVESDGRFDASGVRPISDLWNGFTYFRRGDVIVAKITPCFENGKGACLDNLPTPFGFGSTEFHVIRPSKAILPAYLHRVTTLSEFRRLGADEMTGAAGQQRVPIEFIANFFCPIPLLLEQTAIVRFLDYTDRRIQRVVRARQRRIRLLEEYKRVLINRAVTGRINVRTGRPYESYKDSGLEWLGKVPKHWVINPVKRHYVIQLGKMLQTRANGPNDVELPYLKAQHVQWFSVRTSDTPKMWASPRDIQQFGVTSGDLLVCEGGEGGRCGVVKEISDGFIIQNALHRVRPRDSCLNEYLQYVLSVIAATGWFESVNNRATIAHFTREKFGSLCIPIPEPGEQSAIVQYLDTKTAEINKAITATRSEIDLLREYRTRLIADIVTGKLDVREVARQLPDEPIDEDAEWADSDETDEGEGTDVATTGALSQEVVCQ